MIRQQATRLRLLCEAIIFLYPLILLALLLFLAQH